MICKTLICAVLLLLPFGSLAVVNPVVFNDNNAARFKTYGVSKSDGCDSVLPEPILPTEAPSWSSPGPSKLRATDGVLDLGQSAFRKGDEIVLKKCTEKAILKVAEHLVPYPNKGTEDETVDIYFSCGSDALYVIPLTEEIVFGTPAENTFGTFRLIAPDFNVELNGGGLTRIMRVNRHAHVTVSGIVFRDGREVDMKTDIADAPAGGWSGAAILAMYKTTVIVYKCKFYNNHARSQFARVASGGAIMAETSSNLFVWGSYFKGNQASNGGAIASSMAFKVYIAQSHFIANIARGGFDMSKMKTINGVKKPTLQVRGGAMRFDSVMGHKSSDDHVFLCNCKFQKNKLKMSNTDLKNFGYKTSEAEYLFTGAAAIEMWNKQGTLITSKGDTKMMTMKGCVFDGNQENLPWESENGDLGRYVIEIRGAGHIDIEDTKFLRNKVEKAVAGIDNSDFFKEYKYGLVLRNVEFTDNGEDGEDLHCMRFAPRQLTRCDVENVTSMDDGVDDCFDLQN